MTVDDLIETLQNLKTSGLPGDSELGRVVIRSKDFNLQVFSADKTILLDTRFDRVPKAKTPK